MYAIKARFDGEKVVLPEETKSTLAGDVIVIFTSSESFDEHLAWQKAQESAFAETWDNSEDAVYDEL
ncbi:MAG: hypothetical protein PHU25_17480 [Deltaproteobacteria bacterium]|nr:hypothetical protein [Deltaproteobacteria bacterium]